MMFLVNKTPCFMGCTIENGFAYMALFSVCWKSCRFYGLRENFLNPFMHPWTALDSKRCGFPVGFPTYLVACGSLVALHQLELWGQGSGTSEGFRGPKKPSW